MNIVRILLASLLILIMENQISIAQRIGEWSFIQEPFVNPKIIDDLSTWLSDGGDQVVEINLTESQSSNRYFCTTKSRANGNGYPFVFYERENESKLSFPNQFTYQFVGKTKNGISILRTWDQSGGSGQFGQLMLLTSETDNGVDDRFDSIVLNRRFLIRKLGKIALADRWVGTVQVKGNNVIINQEHTQDSGDDKSQRIIDLSSYH